MESAATATDSTVTVYARDMYAAQGFELSDAERASLVRRAKLFRQIITVNGGTAPEVVTINVPVKHPTTYELVGQLTYSF